MHYCYFFTLEDCFFNVTTPSGWIVNHFFSQHIIKKLCWSSPGQLSFFIFCKRSQSRAWQFKLRIQLQLSSYFCTIELCCNQFFTMCTCKQGLDGFEHQTIGSAVTRFTISANSSSEGMPFLISTAHIRKTNPCLKWNCLQL